MNPSDEPHAAPAHPHTADHPDPITGQSDSHPVGVGLGALGVGAVATAIGAVAGPIGALVGAAIGAVTGGLAGKEAAADAHATDASAYEGGTVLGTEEATGAREAPGRVAAVPVARSTAHRSFDSMEDDPNPLPTASQGLVTPQESTFADPAPGSSALLAEDPLSAAFAVSADPEPAPPHQAGHPDPEHHIRTGAYYRYVQRQHSGQPGDEVGDWVAAEREAARER